MDHEQHDDQPAAADPPRGKRGTSRRQQRARTPQADTRDQEVVLVTVDLYRRARAEIERRFSPCTLTVVDQFTMLIGLGAETLRQQRAENPAVRLHQIVTTSDEKPSRSAGITRAASTKIDQVTVDEYGPARGLRTFVAASLIELGIRTSSQMDPIKDPALETLADLADLPE